MKIGILGSGIFATALAKVLAVNKHESLMWSIVGHQITSINEHNINPDIGYSQSLSKLIKATNNIKEVLEFSDIILIAVPSYVMGDLVEKINENGPNRKKVFINLAKGFHPQSFSLITDFLKQRIDDKKLDFICTIVGPTFAIEVLYDQISQANLVTENAEQAKSIIELFNTRTFKLTFWNDVIGAEFCSAYKNVMAVACGMLRGYNMEVNATAILITNAHKEMRIILGKIGSNPETADQLCGLGDLFLTCSSEKSRNFQAGNKMAVLNSLSDTILKLKDLNITIEGLGTAQIIEKFLKKHNVDLDLIPYTKTIIYILNGTLKSMKPNLQKMLLA